MANLDCVEEPSKSRQEAVLIEDLMISRRTLQTLALRIKRTAAMAASLSGTYA